MYGTKYLHVLHEGAGQKMMDECRARLRKRVGEPPCLVLTLIPRHVFYGPFGPFSLCNDIACALRGGLQQDARAPCHREIMMGVLGMATTLCQTRLRICDPWQGTFVSLFVSPLLWIPQQGLQIYGSLAGRSLINEGETHGSKT